MKKIIKIIIGIIVIFLAIILAISFTKKHSENSKIKEMVEKIGCTYIKTTSSAEKGFLKDIYITIPEPPVSPEATFTNQQYYERIIKFISNALENGQYRIIDESQDVIIRMAYNEGNVQYSINGDNNYYQNTKIEYANLNSKEEKISNISVQSDLLNTLIGNQWSRVNSKSILGTLDSTCNKYDYYFDEGYRIKTVNSKIYNIIFTQKYKSQIFSNITTGMNKNDVQSVLGEPTFENEYGYNLIGYKTNEFYVFFYDGEISIYPTESFNQEKNNRFAKSVSNFLNDNDHEKFVNELIEIYSNYSNFISEENKAEIDYPQNGFKIVFNNEKESGIIIYSNYQGQITEDISAEDMKSGKKLPLNIIYHNNDLVLETESTRIAEENTKRNTASRTETNNLIYNNSSKFNIVIPSENEYEFYSKDKQYADSSFNEKDITEICSLSDNIYIYSKLNSGIYKYDAINHTRALLIADDSDCYIQQVENYAFYYNEKKVELDNNFNVKNIYEYKYE